MKARLGPLFLGSLTAWVVTIYPARWLFGDQAVLFGTVAAVLCLVPAALTLWWAGRVDARQPELALLVVLGGMGMRMIVVLGSGLALALSAPNFRQPAFWLWLLGFYLFTLALEIGLMVSARAASGEDSNFVQ
ncbi:MAG: hypothetical protein ACK4RK_10910 [Gemmataceae bacterium]